MRDNRSGFTLIEMLIVVMIIAILAGIMMGGLYSARNMAAAARTRATIEKLNQVIMKKYASYQYRRVDIGDTSGMKPQVAAAHRLNALHVLMRQEMPDRYSDLNQVYKQSDGTQVTQPAVTQQYKQLCTRRPDDNRDYMAAEFLYMIVMATPEGVGMFSDREIGDIDSDGLPEFVDGWGRPIRYLLWPAGFFNDTTFASDRRGDSDLQVSTINGNAGFVHDPFDTANLNPADPAIYPLIYSAGPDGSYDINLGKAGYGADANTSSYPQPSQASSSLPATYLSPFGFVDGNGKKVGYPDNDDDSTSAPRHFDNVHNHSLINNN